MNPKLFSINQKVVTDIPDDEWVQISIGAAEFPKKGMIYHVKEYKEWHGIYLVRIDELGKAWYAERGFKAFRTRRQNVV